MKSLKNRIIFIALFSLFVMGVTSFWMYHITKNIENEINQYNTKAVKGKILILTIEKDLNYISRCSRDIMLGNDYQSNIKKINYRTKEIETNFVLLKDTIIRDNTFASKMELLKHAENSALFFIHGVQKMMQEFDPQSGVKSEIYSRYKTLLTPPAALSREYFNQIKKVMDKSFMKISTELEHNINNNKNTIIVSAFIASFILVIAFIFIYIISKKQVIVQNNIARLNKMLTKYVIYSKTDLKGKITEASEAFCNISKYTQEELLGQNHNIIRHASTKSYIFDDMWNTIQKNKVWKGELENQAKDGTSYWVYAVISPDYDDYGNKIGYIAVRSDITANKQVELQTKQLLQTEKMASLGEMIGNIAHQWRQPLSVITTGATGMMLQKKFDTLSDKEFENICNAINDNAQYLSKTIDDFRNFIQNERQFVKFNLKETIENFLNLVHPSLKRHNLQLVLDLDESIELEGYANELIQCFMNIFNNSKDALAECPYREKNIFISTKKESEYIIIKFKDNAGGIPEDIINKIFEPYFTTKHKSQGTGLGLHMTYTLITEGMNGTISAQNINFKHNNNMYHGAEFQISLPLKT